VRLVWVRLEAVAETAAVWIGTELQCLRLRLEVRMLAARRRSAIRELGEATYAGDDDAVQGWRSSIETVDAEIARRQEQKAASRAAAAEHARDVQAGARATEIHEPHA
jgi:hypothetical protein